MYRIIVSIYLVLNSDNKVQLLNQAILMHTETSNFIRQLCHVDTNLNCLIEVTVFYYNSLISLWLTTRPTKVTKASTNYRLPF